MIPLNPDEVRQEFADVWEYIAKLENELRLAKNRIHVLENKGNDD